MIDNDAITQTRLDVAEMKGMLSTIVSNHETRLINQDRRLDKHDIRLNDKAKTLAQHGERIADNTEDIKELKADKTARLGRNLGVLGVIISTMLLIVTILNSVAPTL